jgi:hypothetical protein
VVLLPLYKGGRGIKKLNKKIYKERTQKKAAPDQDSLSFTV